MPAWLLSTGAHLLLAKLVESGGALVSTDMGGHERWGFVNSPEEGRQGRMGFPIEGLGYAPELRQDGYIETSDSGDRKVYVVSEAGKHVHAVPF